MRIFIAIAFLFVSSVCSAEVYVLTNDKGEVLSAREADDAVVEDGITKKVLPGTLADYGLNRKVTDYTLNKTTFIQNNTKISSEASAIAAEEIRVTELEKIYKRSLKIACDQLVSEGTVFKEVVCSDFDKMDEQPIAIEK